jgi:hypothetical protein
LGWVTSYEKIAINADDTDLHPTVSPSIRRIQIVDTTSPRRFSLEWSTNWIPEADLRKLDPDAITRFEHLKQTRKKFHHTTMSEHEWSVARTFVPGASVHPIAQASMTARLVENVKEEMKKLSVDGIEEVNFVFADKNWEDELRAQQLLQKPRGVKVRDVLLHALAALEAGTSTTACDAVEIRYVVTFDPRQLALNPTDVARRVTISATDLVRACTGRYYRSCMRICWSQRRLRRENTMRS